MIFLDLRQDKKYNYNIYRIIPHQFLADFHL